MISYFNFTVIVEWATFIATLILLDRRTGYWRIFVLLILLTLCAETTGWYLYSKKNFVYHALPFNILMIFHNVFFIWFFGKTTFLSKIEKMLNILIVVFCVVALINLIFFQGPWRYNSHTESFGDIILSITCCYFLFSLVKYNEDLYLLGFDYFWVAFGVLFYSLGSALLYQFSYILIDYYNQTKINIGTYINYALNLILYGSLIIAFICRRKTTRL